MDFLEKHNIKRGTDMNFLKGPHIYLCYPQSVYITDIIIPQYFNSIQRRVRVREIKLSCVISPPPLMEIFIIFLLK